MRPRLKVALGALTAAALAGALAPAAAHAVERTLTFYSDPITARPYTHENVTVTLEPERGQAPAVPGYITGFREQVLVDRKSRGAKPIPVRKVMVHHLLYSAPERVQNGPAGCWGRSGFFGGRGEEHPSGRDIGGRFPGSPYGILNATEDGRAPTWRLNAMVMNHFDRTKRFYVRTTVSYVTGERRIPVESYTLGDCRHVANAMAYDVPGGGGKGSNFVSRSVTKFPDDWSGRIVLAHSHHHGGAKYQTLASKTCDRPLLRARAYHGTPDHVYNTLRPILHEPGPIANDTFVSPRGIPVGPGEELTRKAVHDNRYPHVAAMGFWSLWLVTDPSVGRCDPLPGDEFSISRPKRYDRTPNFRRGLVPVYSKPRGKLRSFASGGIIPVVDRAYRPARIRARAGERITWRFDGDEPHTVTVANGPRGFSSLYWGRSSGTYSFTPTVKGRYRLYCYVHPLAMSQELLVE